MVARGAGEPSAKRAKVDEAKEEEDPLVRRREELVRLLGRAKGEGNARAMEELVTLCADFEAKNDKLLRRLPPELWHKIVDENVQQNDLLALAMTCRFFREKQKVLGKKVETNLNIYHLLYLNPWSLVELRKSGEVASHTLGWFRWVCDTWEILPGFKGRYRRVKGAVYESDLVNYAALQGSVEILRWLMEEKGWETNWKTGEWAGFGGSVKVLEYLWEEGYKFDEKASIRPYATPSAPSSGAARGGCLEALKFLRGLDPPCPWDKWTCQEAAKGGHLEVLQWLRAQDPPCPWDDMTCQEAALGGHLEVLKWLRSQDPPCPWYWGACEVAARGGNLEVLEWARSQDPPCPWYRRQCRKTASIYGRQHVVKWIDQQEDESDVDY